MPGNEGDAFPMETEGGAEGNELELVAAENPGL